MELNRRNFLKLGAAAGALAYAGGQSVVAAGELLKGGKSVTTEKKALKAIPTYCFQCPGICGIIGYVDEKGRCVKIEGNPEHPNNLGKICAKGQAGMSQAYDAQRILYPMIQTKERGDKTGWKKATWDEALTLVAGRMKKNIDEKRQDKIYLMPGRDRSSGYLARFANAIGTPHVISRSGTCSQSKKTGFVEAWGYDSNWNDYANSKVIFNFGHGILESGSVFVGNTLATLKGIHENGAKLITFDPRYSNTAAKSAEWVPVKPGTDLAIVLAMHYVILKNNLQDPDMVKWFNYPLDKYLAHLESKGYTPAWAEKISGVKAADIERLAKLFATTKPGCVTAYKGVGGHLNGAMTTKAIIILAALAGNLNVKGGTFYNKTASYASVAGPAASTHKKSPALRPNKTEQMDANTSLFEMWAAGKGEVDMIMTWVHNPVYVLGNTQEKINILKDRKKIPFFAAIDLFMSESTALADVILPDVSFLERNDPESHYPTMGRAWVGIRQSVIKNVGTGMEQCEILRAIAKKLGPDYEKWFVDSRVDYVKKQLSGEALPGYTAWGGYEKLKQVGVYALPEGKFEYDGLAKKTLEEKDAAKYEFDAKTNVYWSTKVDAATQKTVRDAAQAVKLSDGKIYKGWNTSHRMIGLMSDKWEAAIPGTGLPVWQDHETAAAKPDEIVLFQYKHPVITHSRTSNCKWLAELFHDNPILLNPVDAKRLGLTDGQKVKVTSKTSSLVYTLKVTEGVVPGSAGWGWGPGHWEYGAFAQAGDAKSFTDANGSDFKAEMIKADPDYGRIWWKDKGANGNFLVPATEKEIDKLGGGQAWNVIVKIEKA